MILMMRAVLKIKVKMMVEVIQRVKRDETTMKRLKKRRKKVSAAVNFQMSL
jgi:hypothetical protein